MCIRVEGRFWSPSANRGVLGLSGDRLLGNRTLDRPENNWFISTRTFCNLEGTGRGGREAEERRCVVSSDEGMLLNYSRCMSSRRSFCCPNTLLSKRKCSLKEGSVCYSTRPPTRPINTFPPHELGPLTRPGDDGLLHEYLSNRKSKLGWDESLECK